MKAVLLARSKGMELRMEMNEINAISAHGLQCDSAIL